MADCIIIIHQHYRNNKGTSYVGIIGYVYNQIPVTVTLDRMINEKRNCDV